MFASVRRYTTAHSSMRGAFQEFFVWVDDARLGESAPEVASHAHLDSLVAPAPFGTSRRTSGL
jgi:hypothetical protein